MIAAAGESDVILLRLRSLPGGRKLVFGLLSLIAGLFSFVTMAGSPGSDAQGLYFAYSLGNEASWLRVQNIGAGDAVVEVNYFNEQGQQAGRDTCPSDSCPALFPGSGWTFFQRDNAGLPPAFQGSAFIQTDQPVVALLAKDVFKGSAFSIAGDTVRSGQGSHKLYLPNVARRDGPGGIWSGRFAIQNLSDSVTACVTITYLSNYTDNEVAWEPYKPTGGTSSSARPGCPQGGMPLVPRGTIFRDPDTMSVPTPFTGSVRVDLHVNAAGQTPDKQWISASVETFNTSTSSLASYRAMDESELGNEIVLPLIDRQVGPENSYSTRFQIVNKNPTTPAQVVLRFDGYDLSGGSPVFISKTNTMTIKGSRLCFQDRDDFANCLGAGDALPFNFVGTAKLTSSQPIGVIVDRGTFLGDGFTNYRGIRPQDGSFKVLLPVLNKNYGSVRGASGWNSWFRAMVADGGTANVRVTYYGLDLPGGSASYTVKVDREFTVFQFLEGFLPNGFAGTAILESDRRIVALADLYTDVFSGDPDLVYNGISLD